MCYMTVDNPMCSPLHVHINVIDAVSPNSMLSRNVMMSPRSAKELSHVTLLQTHTAVTNWSGHGFASGSGWCNYCQEKIEYGVVVDVDDVLHCLDSDECIYCLLLSNSSALISV